MNDGNLLLAVVFAALGVFDIWIGPKLRAKSPGSSGPTILQIAGVMMLGLAALLALGVVKLV